jgi:hypothetical protein
MINAPVSKQQEVKILGDQAEALKRRSLAVGDAA